MHLKCVLQRTGTSVQTTIINIITKADPTSNIVMLDDIRALKSLGFGDFLRGTNISVGHTL